MWRFRYRRELIPDACWEERCNALGAEGWSLTGAPRWRDGQWLCFFKRTVSNREQVAELFALHRPIDERG